MSTQARASSISFPRILISFGSVLGFTVLTAVCAHVKFYLPWTPVPITLQTLMAVLAGGVLGASRGAWSQALLLVAGSMGLPVFTQAGALLGPTGGYAMGFVLAAFAAGALRDAGFYSRSFVVVALALFAVSLFVFVPGVLWLKVLTHISFSHALTLGFWPFLIGDVIKTLAAAAFLKALPRRS